MKQNVYDNPDFFKGYMDLRNSESGFNAAVEEPAVYSLLPPLEGLRVLDLGCGFGKFVSFCLQSGANFVLGTDISQNMILEAKKRIKDPRATFAVIPTEDFEAEENSFDLVVSSMCFHYIEDIRPIFEKVALSLKENGHFIFSVEHPICTSILAGWYTADDTPKKHWPVDDYKLEGQRVSNWFINGVIKYHRTIETYINELIDSGLSIKRLLEPGPLEEVLTERPELSDHMRRPPILVISGTKIAQQSNKLRQG